MEPKIAKFVRINDLEGGREIFGEDLLHSVDACIQCGVCAGSCPVSYIMDYTPRQLVHMIQLGFKQEVLNSNTIWLCTACFSCSVRCPRGIHPTELMKKLKSITIAQGVRNKNTLFERVFSDVIKKNGRASEFLLISKYTLLDLGMIKYLPFGLDLIKKGKLPLFTDKIEDTSEIKAIFKLGEQKKEKERKEGTEI